MRIFFILLLLFVVTISCSYGRLIMLERIYGSSVEVRVVPNTSYIDKWRINGLKILAVDTLKNGYRVYFK